MVDMAVIASNPICLVGGGVVLAQDIALAQALAPYFVAVDSGADVILKAGLIPKAVIGDFDSLSNSALQRLEPAHLHKIDEQDSTDFEKAMARISAPVILAVGFTGARIDHELAVLHGLLRFADKPCVVLGEREVIFHCPPRLDLSLEAEDTVSLFPLRAVQGRSIGLHWPVDGLAFSPGKTIGTSNRATGGPCVLEMDTPGMIALMPRARLLGVMSALQHCAQAHGLWPAL